MKPSLTWLTSGDSAERRDQDCSRGRLPLTGTIGGVTFCGLVVMVSLLFGACTDGAPSALPSSSTTANSPPRDETCDLIAAVHAADTALGTAVEDELQGRHAAADAAARETFGILNETLTSMQMPFATGNVYGARASWVAVAVSQMTVAASLAQGLGGLHPTEKPADLLADARDALASTVAFSVQVSGRDDFPC